MNTYPSLHTRRQFLRTAALAGACSFPFVQTALAAAGSANSDIRIAVIGLGNKGKTHVKNALAQPGAKLVALCDVDPERLAGQMEFAKSGGAAPLGFTDPRKVIEHKDVDVVVIATPNHWHAALAVWACRAGKDVYVEKPVSHNLWEGAQIMAAAKRFNRVVQSGTQYRSDEGLQAAGAWIREGHIGKPRFAHVLWYEYRPGIGRVAPYVPRNLDYDLYCGPAAADPLTRTRLHYDWHWMWSTGDGDLGNSGVHPIDACRMVAGVSALPKRVASLGGRFVVDDTAQTPNTQFTLFDIPGLSMFVENRNLPMKAGMRAMDNFRGIREGFQLECEGGSFLGLRGGGWIYDQKGARVRQFPGDGGSKHFGNFIDAVRSRRTQDLAGPIEQGVASSVFCHLGNLSFRLGKDAALADCRAKAAWHAEAAATFEVLERNVTANGIDLNQSRFRLGPWVELDAKAESIAAVEGNDSALLAEARRIARGSERPAYAIGS